MSHPADRTDALGRLSLRQMNPVDSTMRFTSGRALPQRRNACPECAIARLLLLTFVMFVVAMAWATWDWLPTHHLGTLFRS